jgi:hypothetical protein
MINTNYQSPKVRQWLHMKVILKMEGPLLTNEQKKEVLRVTKEQNIIEGFEKIDQYKAENRGVCK